MSQRPPTADRWRTASRLARSGLVLLVLTVAAGCGPAEEPAVEAGPAVQVRFRNLVVLAVDTLRADHLPTYGYARDTAPFLARLAEEGVTFDGYAASSWTRPSIATMLTGLSPQRHQAIGRSDSLTASVPYLPEVLAQRGFTTLGYMANGNVSRKFGFARGFEHYQQWRRDGKADATQVNAVARRFLDLAEPPFFLWLLYVDPHDPYRPRQVWGEGVGEGEGEGEAESTTRYQPRRLTPEERRSETVLQRMRDQYDGEIREVDRAIGELFGWLESRGLLDSTLVVITSDHGEEFGDHGELTHGRSLYEEVLHVPLFFWASEGLPRGLRGGPFHHVDLFPTLLDALGVAPAGVLPEGLPLSGGSRWTEVSTGGLEAPATPLHFHLDLDGRGLLGVRRQGDSADLKLVLRGTPATDGALSGVLYDLAADPGEQSPLPASQTDAAAHLARLAVDHHNEEGARAAERAESLLDPVEDAELRRQLEALGYLEAETDEEELRRRTLPPTVTLEPSAPP